ncbi:hypothetical protein CDAR_68171 [Caerostris darwini]|uniref:Uncharacterized protein n=1 Tax=Caerostris darwini TaxID=1538125 RepID=A0AAV4VUX6_9ARAC|nr:hypothetical protein CDAR_68171 [Caerostris darwini]
MQALTDIGSLRSHLKPGSLSRAVMNYASNIIKCRSGQANDRDWEEKLQSEVELKEQRERKISPPGSEESMTAPR